MQVAGGRKFFHNTLDTWPLFVRFFSRESQGIMTGRGFGDIVYALAAKNRL